MSLPETLTIEVTPTDIKLGQRKLASYCAVARAVHRILGLPEESVYVDETRMDVYSTSESVQYSLPPEATAFIVQFDRAKEDAKPLTFTATKQRAAEPLF